MKKHVVPVLVAAFVLGFVSVSYAKYVSGFKVVDISEKQVTIQKGDENPIMVTVKSAKKYKVGDKIKYDADKLKIRRIKAKNNYEMGC